MPGISTGNNISNTAQINPGVVESTDIKDNDIAAVDVATDAIETTEIKDGTIADIDISASAAIDDTKLATINEAGKVSGAALTSLASIPAGAGLIPAANLPGGSDTVEIVKPIVICSAITTRGMSNTADAYGYAFRLVKGITVNKISFNVTAVGAAGTVRIGVYSEDGQTREIDVTSGTISGTGVATVSVSAVALSAGIHYIIFAIQTGANLTFSSWQALATVDTFSSISSEPRLMGVLTVTAGALPTTFTTTSSGTWQSDTSGGVVVRLDN